MNLIESLVDNYETHPYLLYKELKEHKEAIVQAFKEGYGDFPLMWVPSDSYGTGGFLVFLEDFSEHLEEAVKLHFPDLDEETFKDTIESLTFSAIPLEDV